MKVLILTNPNYIDFVREIVYKFGKHHLVMIYDKGRFTEWDELCGIGYNIGISFMYQHKVPAKEVNSHTWFNFHPAPLPEYKGRNLCYHAIMNGEKEFGATLHYMDENFDTGDIVEVSKFPVSEKDTAEDLSDIAIGVSKNLFVKYFPRILAGEEFPRIPNVGGTYYPKEEIDEYLYLFPGDEDRVRAITYKNFYPKVIVGGVTYKVVKE